MSRKRTILSPHIQKHDGLRGFIRLLGRQTRRRILRQATMTRMGTAIVRCCANRNACDRYHRGGRWVLRYTPLRASANILMRLPIWMLSLARLGVQLGSCERMAMNPSQALPIFDA